MVKRVMVVRMSPRCKCGNKTLNTDAHCDSCKDRILEKALIEEKRMTIHLHTNCFKED